MPNLSRLSIAVPHDEASGAPFSDRLGRHRHLVIGPTALPALGNAPLPTISVPRKVKRQAEDDLVNLTERLREQVWLAEAIAAANRPNEQDAWQFQRQHVIIENRLCKMFAWQIETLVQGLNGVYTHARALCQGEGEVITIFEFSKANVAASRAAARAAIRAVAGKPHNSKNGTPEERMAALQTAKLLKSWERRR
jgi:hypothetical protein